MNIHVDPHQNKSVIVLEKMKIIGTEATEFQNTILDLIESGNKTIAVDLSQVAYITSWGIGILIYAHTTCQNKNINFYLCGVQEKILETLKKVKLDTIFDIKETG